MILELKNTDIIPIDAVILWVDGGDKTHQDKIRPYLTETNKIKSKKYEDRYVQVDEIKYTIDSILKFASYIRNIFIITDNQTPNFLKSKNDVYSNVSIVDHKVIFKNFEEYLPTFNCRPIETCIHRIPDLSEHFIYFNDDFFLINPTKPEDFFRNGYPILRGVWKKFDDDIFYKKSKITKAKHKIAQQKAAKIIGHKKYFKFRHTPHPLRKSTFSHFFESNPDIFTENIKYKFRNVEQFTPQGLANHIEIKNKTCHLENDFKLLYLRSYKKPYLWYIFKFKYLSKNKLFLGMQNLNSCPEKKLVYLLSWVRQRTKLK